VHVGRVADDGEAHAVSEQVDRREGGQCRDQVGGRAKGRSRCALCEEDGGEVGAEAQVAAKTTDFVTPLSA
jgi:hypothetical protein